ncbi:hypothetical protein FGB62_251g01 [Gracilaria domingensis]|nr:hypothetical protein FGB62_251g01 [Gracilaria domingensis]
MERIQMARIGPVLYGHTDLFLGPFIGRHSSKANFRRVCHEIGEPHRFRRHQPLLVVKSDVNFPQGRLVVVGGGHRILTAAHIMQILLLPYQVLNLDGLTQFGRPVSVLTHDALISHHLEATEPRPEPFSLMEQVLSFKRLMEYWNWCEEQKHVADGKRPKRMPAMTQTKLMALYDSLKEESGENSKYAIEFMSPPKESTCQGYISGARRLLQAGVVEYLCELECAGIATFPRRTLNVVKTWKVEKIRDRVDLWINRRKGGLHCDYKFTDTTGSEVDGRRRGRKRSRSISNSKQFKRPPLGWEQYLDWAQPGSRALLEELDTKVEAEVKEMESSRDPPEAEAFADLMLRQRIVGKVREEVYMTTEQGVNGHEFDLAQMVHDALARHRKDESKAISLMVRGDFITKRSSCMTRTSSRSSTSKMARIPLSTSLRPISAIGPRVRWKTFSFPNH